MKRMVLFFLLSFSVVGCREKKQYGPSKNPDAVFDLKDDYLSGKSANAQCWPQLITIDTAAFIVYLDSADQFVFTSLPDNPVHQQFKVDASAIIAPLGWFTARFSGNELFITDVSNRVIQRFLLQHKAFKKRREYYLDTLFNWDPYSISTQHSNPFLVDSPYLYMPYSIHDPKTHYMDSTRYFLFKFDDKDSSFKKEGKVLMSPRLLKKGVRRITGSTLNKLNDSLILYGFEQYDSMYLYNAHTNQIVASTAFEKSSSYRKFKVSKSWNLAYTRWYDETNEENSRILTNASGTTLVIKKQAKDKIRDKNTFEYYFLDKQLKVTHHEVFQMPINPFFAFAYKKGFIVFSQFLTTAYYYEL